MTMIACTLNKGGPIIIGDLLISSNHKPDKFILPTLLDDVIQYMPEDGDRHPIALLQKIYILAPNVCVAFSGCLMPIKKFLEDLRIFCKIKEVMDFESMAQFLSDKGKGKSEGDFSCVVLVSEGDSTAGLKVGQFRTGNWFRGNSPIFSEVWTMGSGSIDFLEASNERISVNSSFDELDPRHAMQVNTIMLCKLLASERKTVHTVKNHWGAGFEIIYHDKAGFKKVDEITFVVNQGLMNENHEIDVSIPAIVMHYKYYGQDLVITCIRTLKGITKETDTHYIQECSNCIMKPFIANPFDALPDDNLNTDDIDLSFRSDRVAMGYIIETATGYFIPASFNIGPELVVTYNEKEGLNITMMKEVNDRMVKQAQMAFSKKEENP